MDELPRTAPRYIAIDGPIGVGKSALAQSLADRFEGRVILEKVEDNPFLSEFYKSTCRVAFQTQVSFLFNRYQQQVELLQPGLFTPLQVADYLFAKDRIFAFLNLTEEELLLYEKIYDHLVARIVPPDLVVYLQAPADVLMRRLKKRGTRLQRGLDANYLERVVQAFAEFFFNYKETPLLVVNTSAVDFAENEEERDRLVTNIINFRGRRSHYVPLGSI